MPDLFAFVLLSVPLVGAFAIFALGISLIYRASRVLNLAHGAMAMVPAYIAYTLVERVGLPMVVALPAAVASGALLGIGVEWALVRRLRAQGPTAQTVGTVAVTGLLIALVSKIYGSSPVFGPAVFARGELKVAGATVNYGALGLLATAVVVSIALFSFFRFTEVGLALRGAAQNRRAAALMGIDPNLAASAAWGLGGGMAGLAGVLLAALTAVDPYSLPLQVLPAFVAVLVGGMESLPGALVGSVVAGLAFGVMPGLAFLPGIGEILGYPGSPQLVLTLVALVVMTIRGRRLTGVESSEAGLVTLGKPFRAVGKRRARLLVLGGLALLASWPFFAPFSMLGTSLLAIEFALAAISVVVLTGWVGQISLAQASFVGISALMAGILARDLDLGFPANLAAAGAGGLAAVILGVAALRVRGLYLAVATLIFAWMSDKFLLRSPWLGADVGSSTIPSQQLGIPGGYPSFDLTSRKTLFVVMASVLIVVVFALANLRDTKTGRAFFAVRGSEMAAVSLGVDVMKYKLIGFALAGVLAGLAGNLIMIEQRTVVPSQFFFTVSLQFLAIAVVGGLGSLGGAVVAGMLFAALNELFFRVSFLSGWLEVVSAGLLVMVLLVYPGGLAAVPSGMLRMLSRYQKQMQKIMKSLRQMILPVKRIVSVVLPKARPSHGRVPAIRAPGDSNGKAGRHSLWWPSGAIRKVFSSFAIPLSRRRRRATRTSGSDDWFASALGSSVGERASKEPSPDGKVVPEEMSLDVLATERRKLTSERSQGQALIEAEGVIVRFGGLTAVDGASLTVREGEIVGLIGPNGAGKTTLFNAILGLNNPSAGGIKLYGQEVSSMPPHLRARLGVGRTFQVIQLFSELSVFDNLLVATHLRNRSGLFSNLAASAATLRAEAEARTRVKTVLSLLGLEDLSHQGVRGLPFGILRTVELGRALVTGARLVMLDEPASGLNESETDRLSEVIVGVRGLGVSVLLIEHDVRMVTGVSDYMYVLDQGKPIAEGPPAEIQRNPKVIAAYLGGAQGELTEEPVKA